MYTFQGVYFNPSQLSVDIDSFGVHSCKHKTEKSILAIMADIYVTTFCSKYMLYFVKMILLFGTWDRTGALMLVRQSLMLLS